MAPIVVLAVQCTFSLMVFFLIGKWYVLPEITKEKRFEILSFLLFVHVFRYLPLSIFMPGQTGNDFPWHLKEIIAYGDLTAAVLALIAVVLIRTDRSIAIPFTWLFTVVSILDIVTVLSLAMGAEVYKLPLGANYFTVSVYVPMLIVVQVGIVNILLAKKFK